MGKRRIMRKARLGEISAVDKPAQAGALVAIMKRAVQKDAGDTGSLVGYKVSEHVLKIKPHKGEKKDAYVARFMGDSKMNSEYPDQKQRLAIAYHMYGEPTEKAMEPTQAELEMLTLIDLEEIFGKRDFSAKERKEDAKNGAAMPGGGFPIENAKDLENAMRALGRAKNRKATISHIKSRARALGLTDMLSDVYKNQPEEGESVDLLTKGSNSADSDTGVPMTPDEKAQLEALQKRAVRSEQIALLSDAERQLFAKKDEAGKDAFLALTPEARAAEVAKAKKPKGKKPPEGSKEEEDAESQEEEDKEQEEGDMKKRSNPIVETIDGVHFRKNDDPRLVEMAKRLQVEKTARESAERSARMERLQKRASTEMASFAGEQTTKVLLLDAVEQIPEAQRPAVLKMLKGANDSLAEAYTKRGVTGQNEAGSPESQLESLAKSIREREPSLTEAQAFVKAMESPEGLKIYEKKQDEWLTKNRQPAGV